MHRLALGALWQNWFYLGEDGKMRVLMRRLALGAL